MRKKLNLESMRLLTLPIADIHRYAFNPRDHSPEQVNLAAVSIRRYGFNSPVLVSPENVLIAGHCRIAAARQIGMTEVPAIVLPHLSEAEQRAYRIADNAVACLARGASRT